ncbi:recombinase family protein [Micromonospora sp. NBC_01796]|uniref:recombinase family protein n=1 Tax=Micromonospora sp. NBC_01796 TaxID=2975987 RepID=UPI002DD99851|nr:recombinase family protein [Micromonospora sp. NBC_01796]WSA83882.1 recombinase family protein [Micromonospora sp. NBC_01796]
MSTVEYQDPVTSRQWQPDCANELIAARGTIVTEYFDVGCSRRRSWRQEQPTSAALLAALKDPHRGFDAIVVGEYERAFSGNQLLHLAPLLEQHGVQLWLPETDGPVDHRDPTHQALIMLLGAQSKREGQRSRFRVINAMRAQPREQGRYLGGRPPYGYRLTDAGPHPKRAHARWGRRLTRLEPDPATAAHVRWMFTQRLTGQSLASLLVAVWVLAASGRIATAAKALCWPRMRPHRSGATSFGTVQDRVHCRPGYRCNHGHTTTHRHSPKTKNPLPPGGPPLRTEGNGSQLPQLGFTQHTLRKPGRSGGERIAHPYQLVE